MSSLISGVASRKSLTARSMSFDWVMYRPTMMMSAPFCRASRAVSGTIPPATAMRNFLSLKVWRISGMISIPCVLPVSWSMPLCRIIMSGNSLRDLSFLSGSSTLSMSTTPYVANLFASWTKASSVSAGASPEATTASAVSS